MQARVIAIDHPVSARLADRCVKSGARFGVHVDVFMGVQLKDNPRALMEEAGIPTTAFDRNKMAKPEHCMACFLSHRWLWQECATGEEPMVILEHDAVFVGEVPDLGDALVVNLGHPSYEPYFLPSRMGLGPLASMSAFPGAHGYYVSPEGARKLLEKEREAKSPDRFMHRERFPFLQEYCPWPVIADDAVSTTQHERGCRARVRNVVPLEVL